MQVMVMVSHFANSTTKKNTKPAKPLTVITCRFYIKYKYKQIFIKAIQVNQEAARDSINL